jgi:hypothetical protein
LETYKPVKYVSAPMVGAQPAAAGGSIGYIYFCFGIHFVEHFNNDYTQNSPRLSQVTQYNVCEPIFKFPASDLSAISLHLRVFLFVTNAASVTSFHLLSSATFFLPDDFCLFLALDKCQGLFLMVDPRTHVFIEFGLQHFCDLQLCFVR